MASSSNTTDFGILPSDVSKIANYSIQDELNPQIELAQASHRIKLINVFNIQPGSRVLEIGCGQGNCTTVLASAVGGGGHVDAVDPAPLDYGSPYTLKQAQEYITSTEIGSIITWHKSDPLEFLDKAKKQGKTWDVAVFVHSIWYFDTPHVLPDIMKALQGRVPTICVAEYALSATQPEAQPHVLAAVACGFMESFGSRSSGNIQTPLDPVSIQTKASSTGWNMGKETYIVPDESLDDGRWEVGSIIAPTCLADFVEKTGCDQRTSTALQCALGAVTGALRVLNGKRVRSMDVWAAVFTNS
jgi:SAM-dependent methyltransferase